MPSWRTNPLLVPLSNRYKLPWERLWIPDLFGSNRSALLPRVYLLWAEIEFVHLNGVLLVLFLLKSLKCVSLNVACSKFCLVVCFSISLSKSNIRKANVRFTRSQIYEMPLLSSSLFICSHKLWSLTSFVYFKQVFPKSASCYFKYCPIHKLDHFDLSKCFPNPSVNLSFIDAIINLKWKR